MTNMHTVKSFCAAAALAALLVASPVSSQDAVERSVLIGLVNNNEPGFRAEVLTPTLDYLKKTLPNISFRTVDIAAYKAVDDLFRTRPDFVIAPSDVFVTLSSSSGCTQKQFCQRRQSISGFGCHCAQNES